MLIKIIAHKFADMINTEAIIENKMNSSLNYTSFKFELIFCLIRVRFTGTMKYIL